MMSVTLDPKMMKRFLNFLRDRRDAGTSANAIRRQQRKEDCDDQLEW